MDQMTFDDIVFEYGFTRLNYPKTLKRIKKAKNTKYYVQRKIKK